MTAAVSTFGPAAAPLDYWAYQVAKSPPWMQLDELGINWSTAFGLMKDVYAAGIRLAVKCRFPDFAPPDALDSIGVTLGGITRDMAPTDAQYIAKLDAAWDSAVMWGTLPGMVAALTRAGLANVAVWESWSWPGILPNLWSDGKPANSFTITCSLPTPWNSFPLADGSWGDGDATKTWDDGGVWASGIPHSWRVQLKALIDREKPLHSQCAAVIVNLNTGPVWDLGNCTEWDGGWVWSDAGTVLYINMLV